MTNRIKNEDDLLKEEVRHQIITEIEGAENKRRKSVAYKWHEIWKNKSKQYVRELLTLMLDTSTVREMEYAMSNISVTRKIIDKLARVYSNGVTRSYEDNPEQTERLDCLGKLLQANAQMKTLNKLLKLQKNSALYCKPIESTEGTAYPAWIPMSPHLYDVVEKHNDRTKPLAFILSNFEREALTVGLDSQRVPELAATHRIQTSSFKGDGVDQKIADRKEDEGEDLHEKKTYIWWTDKYHFTTKGSEIIDPSTGEPYNLEGEALMAEIMNPIEELPFVDLHIDQEGHYWAEGGEDLIDGDLLLNCMLSNAHHIGVTQGYGQLVMIGKNLPQTVKLGPNKTINLPVDDEGTTTSAEFITASPPLDALASQVEMYLALLLTTNNLSTSGVRASLDGGVGAASGVALALDKSESLEDVQSQRDIFVCAEKDAIRKTAKWLNYFSQENMLDEKYAECLISEDVEPMIEFGDQMILMSEKEKLDNIKLRDELGINTQIELIMKDRGVSEREAEDILKKILEEKIANQTRFMDGMGDSDNASDDTIVDDDDDTDEDDE